MTGGIKESDPSLCEKADVLQKKRPGGGGARVAGGAIANGIPTTLGGPVSPRTEGSNVLLKRGLADAHKKVERLSLFNVFLARRAAEEGNDLGGKRKYSLRRKGARKSEKRRIEEARAGEKRSSTKEILSLLMGRHGAEEND